MTKPEIFKSNSRIWYTFSLSLVVFLTAAYMSFTLAQQGHFFNGLVMLLCGILICVFSFLVSISQQSNIVVDDQGISKSLFGKTWRSIQWKNVREIQISLIPRFSKPPVKCCVIFPSFQSNSGKKGGGISFDYERNNICELLEAINHYISEYNIKIQSQIKDIENITHLTI